MTLEQLPEVINSDLDGNPPLYVTRRREDNKEEIYVNNARVLRSRSNKIGTNLGKRKTVSGGGEFRKPKFSLMDNGTRNNF